MTTMVLIEHNKYERKLEIKCFALSFIHVRHIDFNNFCKIIILLEIIMLVEIIIIIKIYVPREKWFGVNLSFYKQRSLLIYIYRYSCIDYLSSPRGKWCSVRLLQTINSIQRRLAQSEMCVCVFQNEKFLFISLHSTPLKLVIPMSWLWLWLWYSEWPYVSLIWMVLIPMLWCMQMRQREQNTWVMDGSTELVEKSNISSHMLE